MDSATHKPTCIEDKLNFDEKKGKEAEKIDIYCDSSYSYFPKGSDSYIGCVILNNGKFVHQSTTQIKSNPTDNQECEREAIKYSIKFNELFLKKGNTTIYNDSRTILSEFADEQNSENEIEIEHVSRYDEFQWIADKLSKEMMYSDREMRSIPVTNSEIITCFNYSTNEEDETLVGCQIIKKGQCIHQSTTKIEAKSKKGVMRFVEAFSSLFITAGETVKLLDSSDHDYKVVDKLSNYFKYYDGLPSHILPKCSFSCLSEKIRSEISKNKRNVFYVEEIRSTKTRKYYKLVIASSTKILHEEELDPVKKGGDGLHIKVAEQVYSKICNADFQSFLENKGIKLQNSYFLITNELTSLTFNDYITNSIFPKSIEHKIIGDRRFYSKSTYFKSDNWVFQQLSDLLTPNTL